MHSVEPAERVGRRVATIAAVLAGAIALAGVLGTILEAPLLTAVLPGAVSIKFNTAVGLTLASVAVVLVIARFRRSAGVLLGLVTALGAVQLAQDILGIDVGLDELLIRDHWSAVDTFRPGGMSPISAACFVLAGIAGFLLVRPSRRAILAGQAVAFLVFAVSLHALFGYACDIPAFYSA